MDNRLIKYYDEELRHIRQVALEFARESPKIAERLGLDTNSASECSDPYVERLLEGFAFLAGRVRLKLDAEFPRVTQSLLETVFPHYLAPMPSMCIVQFQPDPAETSLAEGRILPRDTILRSDVGKGEQTKCEYRTAHAVMLLPVEVREARYFARDLAKLEPPNMPGIKAAVQIKLTALAGLTFDKIAMDRIAFYISGAGALQAKLYEEILAHTLAVVVQPTSRPVKKSTVIPARDGLRAVGFDESEALLPPSPRSFSGYRLLQEYFAFSQRFMFFELAGLRAGVNRASGAELELILYLDRADPDLENNLSAGNFVPFCSPAVNLFPKRATRISLSDGVNELQVVGDRTRPRDYEIYRVKSVTGFGTAAHQEREFKPFYSAKDYDSQDSAYFTVFRTPRMPSERERRVGQRIGYAGGDVFVSLVDAADAPYSSDLRELSVDTLCTNRDLPIIMPVGRSAADFSLQTDAPVQTIRCINGRPSAPRPSFAEQDTAWRLVSHLSLNYLSLINSDPERGAVSLRELLSLYGDWTEAATRRQIEGVKHISSSVKMARVPTPGPIAFARGLQIDLTLDETAFEGSGIFLLGAVLEQFFARYVSINSFTETVVRSTARGEIMRWPARMGVRDIL